MMDSESDVGKMRPKEPIPRFASRDEEADFWDTHDFADYWDDFRPARVRFSRNLAHGITVRLDADTLAKLRAAAHERGIGPTTLVRMWVLERLRQDERAKSA